MPILAFTPARADARHARASDQTLEIEAGALAADLRRAIRGEVRFDRGSRALYATDGSNYRQPPIGVVIPRTVEDVERAVAVCRRYGAPIFGRGGGTSLAGQCCNAAVCFDFSKYLHRVLAIDERKRLGRVEPGTILDDLRHRAERHGLTFGPDPATHTHCTLGGMVGNDSCGVHSVMAQFRGGGARTADNVESLEVLTYDGLRMRVGATSEYELESIVRGGGRRGDIYAALKRLRDKYAPAIRARFPPIPRRVSGYNLPYLLPEAGFNVARALVGSESTCVMVLEIVAQLIPNPPARALLVLGYPDVYEAGDHGPEVMEYRPIGLEGMDDRLVKDMKAVGIHAKDVQLLPEGGGWLLVEFGGESREDAVQQAHRLMADLVARGGAPHMKLVDDPAVEEQIWKVRESGLAATAHVSGQHPTWEGWEDSAVPPEKLGEYLRKLRALFDKHGLACDLYGHFGQGCVHTRIDFDLETAAGIRRYRTFIEEASDLVASLGGSFSGEHGDGQSRGELLPKMFGGEIMQAFREFKAIWDPDHRMNPHKGPVDPAPLDVHLRLGTTYAPPNPPTHFQFPDDSGSFAKATLRCVGVGACRREEGGTMCPSYMVTREEEHSTRGRAHLLFEMLEGDPLTGGWQDEHVKRALDLCLSCKGCKHDCPVRVDMATYKAEFLSHYYEGHARPRSAYAFGLVALWARIAARMPRAVNLATQTPGLRDLVKIAAGMPLARPVPAFAPFTFKDWFARRPARPREGRRVVLWPDTFNNHFHPRTAIATTRALEAAGFRVEVPRRPLCCGRPLYDYGMLETAKAWLAEILHALRPAIEAGIPVVGIEPSCTAVFRDELRQMFPHDENAKRLAEQTFLLGEFLDREHVELPKLERRALLHGHCHQRAVLDFGADQRVLQHMGLQIEAPQSGCCGMAGSFGFERAHYDVSMRAGERVLLPAVREAPKDTLIVADGFSCRTQIANATNRRALHLADVLALALDSGPRGPAGNYPEREYVADYARTCRPSNATLAAIGLFGAAAVGLALARKS